MMVGRITLRRRRRLGAIIGDGFRIYGMPDLISMLFILALPGAALNLLLLAGRLRMSGLAENSLWIPGSVLGALVGTGAIYALDQYDKGNPGHAGEALVAAFFKALQLIGASLRQWIIIALFLCTIVGSPWGIHRLFRWYFYRHAIMLDGQDGQTALDYSADLVAGRWWPTTGLLVATLAVTLVPIAATNVILNSASSQLIAGLVNAVLAAAAFPYLTSVTLMIYYDLKLRREPLPPLQYASSE